MNNFYANTFLDAPILKNLKVGFSKVSLEEMMEKIHNTATPISSIINALKALEESGVTHITSTSDEDVIRLTTYTHFDNEEAFKDAIDKNWDALKASLYELRRSAITHDGFKYTPVNLNGQSVFVSKHANPKAYYLDISDQTWLYKEGIYYAPGVIQNYYTNVLVKEVISL